MLPDRTEPVFFMSCRYVHENSAQKRQTHRIPNDLKSSLSQRGLFFALRPDPAGHLKRPPGRMDILMGDGEGFP
jgi:hypothetical protein